MGTGDCLWSVTAGQDGHRILVFFGSKMDKTDNNSLTNHPETETGSIPFSISSRIVGCWGVGEEAVFDE